MCNRSAILVSCCCLIFYACNLSRKTRSASDADSSITVTQLLEKAWEIKPSSFLFSGDSLQGVFQGGIKGLVLYSNFNEAVNAYLHTGEDNSHAFYDLSPLTDLAGIPIFLNRADSLGLYVNTNTSFVHYNPDWIKWATTHLIPNIDEIIGGKTAQQWYDDSFRRFFRLMVESHQFLENEQLWEYEKLQYSESLKNPSFDALAYFDQRFSAVLDEYQYPYSHEVFTGPMAISFWLRRDMDKSRTSLWNGLSIFMNKFDPLWFQEHT